MVKIKSVIFDWGGVLIDDPAPGRARYFAELLGTSAAEFEEAFGRFGVDFQKGLICEGEFWGAMCGRLKVSKPEVESLWGQGFEAVYREKAEMFELASILSQNGYKTALLSNTEAPPVEYFHRRRYDMFDVLVFSCEVGVAKPGREIYEIALGKLGCGPEECVFIDDKQDYIEGAKAVRLNTIVFESVEQVKSDLLSLGVRHKGRPEYPG